jgi:hypothetical protein
MMPKQYMTMRNKQHRGPMRPRVASKKHCDHAYQRGCNAWLKYGKSINDNPYRGLEAEAWRKGYLAASNFKVNPVVERAPQGRASDYVDSYVVVKRTGADKRPKGKAEPRERDTVTYLGYIKPGKDGRLKRFYPWSNNPPEDEWRNKIACKSYKEPKDVEST